MQVFLSTTFNGKEVSNLNQTLELAANLPIDGIELGSTHSYQQDIVPLVKSKWGGRLLTHNFFPPSKDPNFFINLASDDENLRKKSVNFVKKCLDVADELGAEIYTIHPGFLAKPIQASYRNSNSYDIKFSNHNIPHEVAFTNMFKSLNIITEYGNRRNVLLALETEGSLTKPGVCLMEDVVEYDRLYSEFGNAIHLNINLAHTRFAAKTHGYLLTEFINRYRDWIVAAEISHNDGFSDQHKPLIKDSYVFKYIHQLPEIPMILEFRDSTLEEVKYSIKLIRET